MFLIRGIIYSISTVISSLSYKMTTCSSYAFPIVTFATERMPLEAVLIEPTSHRSYHAMITHSKCTFFW